MDKLNRNELFTSTFQTIVNDLRTRVLGDITARRATTNCSWVVKVVGRVNTSKQVDAIITVEELSNLLKFGQLKTQQVVGCWSLSHNGVSAPDLEGKGKKAAKCTYTIGQCSRQKFF